MQFRIRATPLFTLLKVILIYYRSTKKFTERFLSYYGGSGVKAAVLEQKHPKMSKLSKF